MDMLELSFISVSLSWGGCLQTHLAVVWFTLSFPLQRGFSWLPLQGLGMPKQSHQLALLSHAGGGAEGRTQGNLMETSEDYISAVVW